MKTMGRVPHGSLLPVLAVGTLLFGVHFALLPRSVAFGLWTSKILLILLGCLQQIGLPVLTGSFSKMDPNIADPSRIPGATILGTCILITVWWGSCFLITLVVVTFVRYIRRDASRSPDSR
jgi:hypothetical protein